MDLKQNTLRSATSSTDQMEGYSLKPNVIDRWLEEKKKTREWLAHKLKIPPSEFDTKLQKGEVFDKEQLWRLIKIMLAQKAFEAIYFPTKKQRAKVWWEVFGKYKGKEELNE